mgnify:CR=1 FL=1
MVTIALLQEYGLQVSNHISPERVVAAQKEVEKWYITPLAPTATLTADPYKSAIVYLTFIYLVKQGNTFETRSGAVLKNREYSYAADAKAKNEYTRLALRWLRECEVAAGVKFDRKNDVCKLLFDFNL